MLWFVQINWTEINIHLKTHEYGSSTVLTYTLSYGTMKHELDVTLGSLRISDSVRQRRAKNILRNSIS